MDMKRIGILVAGLCCMGSAMAANVIEEVPVEKLPHLAGQHLKAYFPGIAVAHATRDKGGMKNHYEVVLEDSTVLEFDKDGNWMLVDCGNRAVPQRNIPGMLIMELQKNHPGVTIVKMTRDRKEGYILTTSEGEKLMYDINYKPLKQE